MSKTGKNLVWFFCSKLIEWAFRKRGIARTLIVAGISLILAAVGINWAGKLLYKDETRSLNLSISTTDAFPSWVYWGLLGLGLLLLVTGVIFAVWDAWRDAKASQRCRALVIEVRGLHSSPDSPLENAKISSPGVRQTVLIDFRPASEQELVNPDAALDRISGLKSTLTSLSKGLNRSDISIVVGGLAPVPTLVLVGALLDDESEITVFDWDRSIGDWRETNQVDDGARLRILNAPTFNSGITEAVLAVSASYEIRTEDLDAKFPSLPRLVLSSDQPISADRFWSLEKQSAYIVTIREAIQHLTAAGVKRIHMVLAAPSSLSLRVGMAYDRRLSAELVVYQYERRLDPPYPWGILLPSACFPTPSVIR
ncbi:SAVED domain-containing protein [Alcaligenes phenolicus]|uniref:SAVED domain-containing protein n=1 Tax=Alcaligenes phenolicus TaxID=232846 RepID=UPI002D032BE4|nr:SAVED domain-containing protein [Alcaligenes phenolicus]HRO19038.1 SAVED domain-containing protein [Alcaligenes phenolicus]HRP14875.1 SAVED domain-containing protein [Alcaligenes phenolicus]